MRLSRRQLVLAAAATAAGLPLSTSWAMRGRRGSTLRIAFYTDVHTRLEWETPKALERTSKAINAEKADLVLAGGDLITDGFQSGEATVEPRWQAYMTMHDAIAAPVTAALGNHDLVAALPLDGSAAAADPRMVFRSQLGVKRTFQAFDAGGYHIIVLASVAVVGGELKYEGRIDQEQLIWLRRHLEGVDAGTPLVLLTHIPLLTAFYQATEGVTVSPPANRVVVNNVEALDLFADHNLILVLQGHLHVDEMLRWRDTTFITGGAVSGKWWRGPWHGTSEGFGVVTLRPDRVEWEYRHYGWEARRP